jgi:cellobiose phosphorylase
VAITQHIIGVRPEIDGLHIDPCLPAELGHVRLTRHCRNAEYRITIENRASGRAPKLTTNGTPHDGNVVPYAPPGSVVEITVEA